MKKLLKIIVNNWPAKLIAVFLAFGLWAFVVNTGYRQEVLAEAIPVTPRDLATDLAIANDVPDVQVEVFAPTAAFQRLTPQDLTASINLAGLEKGRHTLEIKVFAEDPNVRIVEITPALAEVVLEPKTQETFAINVETEGQLGQGFVADKPEVDPKEIMVEGAASKLEKIDQVVVRAKFNGETADLEKTLIPKALDIDRQEIHGLTFDPEQVKVKFPVIIADDAKTVGVEAQTFGSPADGFFVGAISIEPSTVTAQGSSKVLEEITSFKTESIDISGATENIETTVKLDLPDNVRAEPEQIKVNIEIKAGTSTIDLTIPPQIVNLGSGLASTVNPPNLSITLSGPSNLLQNLDSGSVHLTVDVSGKGEGQHQIALIRDMLDIDQEIQVSFSVGTITVSITTN